LEYKPSETHKNNLEKAWRWTFKRFMMIDTKTSNSLVNEMINSDLQLTHQFWWKDANYSGQEKLQGPKNKRASEEAKFIKKSSK